MLLTLLATLSLAPSAQESPMTVAMLAPCAEVSDRVCRLPGAIDASVMESRLGQDAFTFWAEGEVLHIAARRRAPLVTLCCALQSGMEQIAGHPDLWALSARVPDLDKAVIELMIFSGEEVGPPLSKVPQWRGPQAPARGEGREVPAGWITEHRIQSAAMGEPRDLTIYRPPGDGPFPVIYLADGETVSQFAMTIQPLIERGGLPPLMIVGLHSGPAGATGGEQTNLIRHQEYLTGWAGEPQPRWLGHDRFLREEVMPMAESLGASSRREDRAVAGFSNGAAWALAMATDHPDLFGKVIGLSFGWHAGKLEEMLRTTRFGDVWLGAGTLEPEFHATTRAAAGVLESQADRVAFDSRVSGHSPVMWNEQFPVAAVWVFNPDGRQFAPVAPSAP